MRGSIRAAEQGGHVRTNVWANTVESCPALGAGPGRDGVGTGEAVRAGDRSEPGVRFSRHCREQGAEQLVWGLQCLLVGAAQGSTLAVCASWAAALP